MRSGKTFLVAALLVSALGLSSCRQASDSPAPRARAARGAIGGDGGVWLAERSRAKTPGEVEPAWADPADELAGAATEELRIGPKPIEKPDPYRVRSGDILIIDVLGESDMRREIPVGPDGRMSYYIAHNVEAAGKTFTAIRGEIAKRLRAHYRDPQVSVVGKSYAGNTVSVLGVVKKAGRHEIRSDTRLIDAIALAGGIPVSWQIGGSSLGAEDVADLEHAYLLRDGKFVDVDFVALFKGAEEEVSKNNVLLKPNDRIYVPPSVGSNQRIIVLGEVNSPGVVRYSKRISFLEAIAESGGVRPSAWERRSFVVRGRLSSPNVMMGRRRDIELAAGDIVLVPKHALGKLEEVARQVLPLLNSVNTADTIRGR